MPWPQDILQRPSSTSATAPNPQLAALKRESYAYVAQVDTLSSAQIVRTFQVDPTNDFWCANVSVQAFSGFDSVATPQGNLTVRDLVTNYAFIEGVPLATITDPATPYYRTILPAPYGIAALGSFEVRITFFGTVAPLNVIQQVTIEGWKDFTFGGGVS